jgi:hypothetical protein
VASRKAALTFHMLAMWLMATILPLRGMCICPAVSDRVRLDLRSGSRSRSLPLSLKAASPRGFREPAGPSQLWFAPYASEARALTTSSLRVGMLARAWRSSILILSSLFFPASVHATSRRATSMAWTRAEGGGPSDLGGDDGRDGVRELPVKKAKGQLAQIWTPW